MTDDLRMRLEAARARADRFEERIWRRGIDLEDMDQDDCAEYQRLCDAERELVQRVRAAEGLAAHEPV